MRRFLYGLSLSRPVLCGRCLLSAFHSRVVRLILYAVCVRRLLPVFALYCAAAAACTFDPRMPVLPVLRFLLSYGCCLNRIRCCMAATASAYGCAAVFVCCAAGGLWRRVSCGMVWRRECEDALRRCGSLPCFCTLSSFFALFLTFCFIPRLIFPSLPSALAFARSLASPPFSLLFPSHPVPSSHPVIFARFSWRTAFFR